MERLINDGDRPSRFRIDQHLTGERVDSAVEHYLASGPGVAVDRELARAREAVGPLDLAALRRRAAADPPAANNTHFFALAGLLVAAALALFVVGPRLVTASPGVDPHYVGVRGTSLGVYVLQEGTLQPYDDRALGEGDVVGFKVDPGPHAGVVLLSVDGEGTVSVFYPESGERPEPLSAPGPLPGSVQLDDAPGPEVFVALFDVRVSEAKAAAREAWARGATDGLLEWMGSRGDVDGLVVRKQ